jgi:hypothetical protein
MTNFIIYMIEALKFGTIGVLTHCWGVFVRHAFDTAERINQDTPNIFRKP